jgi:hypothetical protein
MRWRRRLFTKLTVAAAVLGGALPAREAGADAAPPGPQDPIVTDRPDFTESAETVPAGRTQVEGGVTFRRNGRTRSWPWASFCCAWRPARGRSCG